jgi:LPXTG-site transpeptidase (sortase) family protein
VVHSSTPLRWWLWSSLAVTGLIVSMVALAGASPARQTDAIVLAQSNVMSTASASTALPATGRSQPIRLTIPAIGVTTTVGKLGLQPDGQVMVPTTTRTTGWYIDGPAPGQLGSAVILGHVDSYKGAGVFFNLKSLKAGDRITVLSQDGVVTYFKVTRVVQYSKTKFPDQLVYGPHGTRSLQLVTCGGVFDHATGHYESNIVVFSDLVGVTPPAKAAVS